MFDDLPQIVENPLITDLQYFVDPARAAAAGATPVQLYGLRSRWVAFLTFALNFRLHGLDPFGYHLVNLFIHLLSGLLLFRLVRRTLLLPRFQNSALHGHEASVAFFSAAWFLVHPVQTQAVTYIVQRMASLAAMFCLLALAAYVEARISSRRGIRCSAYALSVLALVAAMYTKQNAATFPLLILLYELLFFDGPLRRRLVGLLPHLATMAIVPASLLRAGAAEGGLIDAVVQSARGGTTMARLDYFATQLRVIVTYLRLLVWPAGQNLDYDYPVHHSLVELPVLLSLLLLTGLAALALVSIVRSRHGEPAWRLVGFGILWFFVALAVESSFIPIADVIFEHRLYLPSAGFLTAAVTALRLGVPARGARALAGALAVALLAFAVATTLRNRVWSSPVRLWKDTAAKSPNKARVRYSLGFSYQLEGDLVAAKREWEASIRIDPEYSWALNSLGAFASERGDLATAYEYLQRAVASDAANMEARMNLAMLADRLGDDRVAMLHFSEFLSLTADKSSSPSMQAASRLIRIASACLERGDLATTAQALSGLAPVMKPTSSTLAVRPILDEARRRITAAAPNLLAARLAMAGFLTDAGARADAVTEARQALALSPDSVELANRVANLLRRNGATSEAIRLLRATIGRSPSDAILFNSLGAALRAHGDLEEAAASYRQALAIDPSYAEAHHNLGNLYGAQRKWDLALAEFEAAIRLLPDNPVVAESLRAARIQAVSGSR